MANAITEKWEHAAESRWIPLDQITESKKSCLLFRIIARVSQNFAPENFKTKEEKIKIFTSSQQNAEGSGQEDQPQLIQAGRALSQRFL